MSTQVFGIRHHGPGCARSLRAALEAWRPDVVVVEGPTDAEDALQLARREELRPPVALLIYAADEPSDASYYPFAEFSPEWQAIRWAHAAGVPVRLMDLPQTHQIAIRRKEKAKILAKVESEAQMNARGSATTAATEVETSPSYTPPSEEDPAWRTDPLALLAEAAGYKDHELWWEHQIERRKDPTDLFTAIVEAMRVVRGEIPGGSERDLMREAHMRRTIRAVRREKFERVAVVCGAWHAPVLDDDALDGKREGCRTSDDESRLRGLEKVKTITTWIPWTNSRLTYRSGYGAGINSPGWYAHLWHAPASAAMHWLATAARLLREADLDASSASVIEAVRLSDALAAMRDLRSPGLAELNEAILSVYCHGESAPLRLIRDRLEIGTAMGEVPDDVPAVPLLQDLARLQKSLRLKASAEIVPLDLDLRKESDLERSRLLRRLNLLGVDWGKMARSDRRTSTFHEVWRLSWEPEFAVRMIEASVWGNTIVTAASAKTVHEAESALELARVIELLDDALKSGLNSVIDRLVGVLHMRAAVAADVRQLMDAMLPLARLARYGDVRGTQAEHVEPLLVGLFERASVGLRAACTSLDEEAAQRILAAMTNTTQALDLLGRDDLNIEWCDRLAVLVESDVSALVRGWCCRTLLERNRLSSDDVARIAGREMSRVLPPAECALWATGLLRGSGLVLLHLEGIWIAFDRWLAGFSAEEFQDVLPLVRRAFSDFAPAERRQMGERVRQLKTDGPGAAKEKSIGAPRDLDEGRAAKVLPILARILGVTP